MPGLTLAFRMLVMLSAAFTGTVLFSTTILELLATSAIRRAQDSTNFRSAARPCAEDARKSVRHNFGLMINLSFICFCFVDRCRIKNKNKTYPQLPIFQKK